MENIYKPKFRQRPYAMKKHWATRLHDDLRLEWNGVLLSWALIGKPIFRVGETRVAIEMEDHNKENILFEGIHRTGTIMVWDCGSWEPLIGDEGVLNGLKNGFLRFVLRGGKLQGIWTLSRNAPASGAQRAVWTLRKEADLFDYPSIHDFSLEAQPISICTGRTQEEIVLEWYRARTKQWRLFN